MTAKERKKEEAVARIMKGLKCSREEAEDVYTYDQKVERDEKTEFDLAPAKAKIAQQMAHTGTRTVKEPVRRTHKENLTKAGLIAKLADFLQGECENVTVLNKERMIGFQVGTESYELTLVQKRKPKK